MFPGPDGDSAVKTLKTDESYTLVVKAPRISIAAKSVFGAMHVKMHTSPPT